MNGINLLNPLINVDISKPQQQHPKSAYQYLSVLHQYVSESESPHSGEEDFVATIW